MEHTGPTTAPPATVTHWWRVFAIALAVVLAVGLAATLSLWEQLRAQLAHTQSRLNATAQIRHIAVLLDEQHSPALLVTFDPKDEALQLQRLNAVKEGREDTLQLWALQPGQPPVSLGAVLSKAGTVRLVLSQGANPSKITASPRAMASLDLATALAISVENKGGVSEPQGPRLPYLWQGAWVKKAL